MPQVRQQPVDPCPFGPVVDLVFGRWTAHVLWVLAYHGRVRFKELQGYLPEITPKVLTERLRQLERNGLVARTYHREIPPRVEYEMTALGQSLVPVFRTLTAWSDEHLDEVQAAQRDYDREHALTGTAGGVAAEPVRARDRA
ncbi:transcriptional regulator [Streptomyces cyaneochromogenes]|uniref:Transcriptional regulator n=1 Tax=Streptomyces cyaneochromogenes TaxID=2496836 RepID=A0A3Q9EP55_9ACTN|nr:helix-turn-helix domain-containing protein [Streptomyces cyaneochromogenes]AZQ32845.1 transcriptional regulator [Streptomyces cyaneochromogenes]